MIALIIVLFVITAALIYVSVTSEDEIKQLENEIECFKSSCKFLKSCIDDLEIDKDSLTTSNNVLLAINASNEEFIRHLSKELEGGVFYDKENDTIVMINNLEKLGDL